MPVYVKIGREKLRIYMMVVNRGREGEADTPTSVPHHSQGATELSADWRAAVSLTSQPRTFAITCLIHARLGHHYLSNKC